MQTISNTSIVSVHTFLMRLPVVAKGFARYNKVLINFQTIVSGVCLWLRDRHAALDSLSSKYAYC